MNSRTTEPLAASANSCEEAEHLLCGSKDWGVSQGRKKGRQAVRRQSKSFSSEHPKALDSLASMRKPRSFYNVSDQPFTQQIFNLLYKKNARASLSHKLSPPDIHAL
eukprot:140246-Pelagomonas_calceolata.AAC.2